VMWLVAAVSKEQRAAMFEYFHNPSMEQGKSVKAAPGQAGPGGASTSVINLHGGLDAPMTYQRPKDEGLGQRVNTVSDDQPTKSGEAPKTAGESQQDAEARESRQLQSLEADLRAAIEKSQALEPFKDQLLLDITPEGLRIQIVDKQNRPMFDSGSSTLKDYSTAILRELPAYLNTVPNRISISGHTDAQPYVSRGSSYSNWELSADRANAARRALQAGGLEAAKSARIVGLASSVLFDKNDPLNPINRRISIIVMTKRAEEAALKTDAPLAWQSTKPAAETVDGAANVESAAPSAAASPVPPLASAAP